MAQATRPPYVEASDIDASTARILVHLVDGEFDLAQPVAARLVANYPDFALGQLLYGELQSIAANKALRISDQYHFSPQLMDLLLEAQTRLAHESDVQRVRSDFHDHVPASVLQTGDHIDHVIVVDLQQLQLYLFDTRGHRPQLLVQHYVSGGSAGFGKWLEGDGKTPLGSYRITGWRDGDSLPDLYGNGALMLDYPNPLDVARGKTGSGIWLHGVPQHQRSRPPRSSEGCVTMSNDYLDYLQSTINISRVRVVLGTGIHWQSQQANREDQSAMLALFDQYRTAWASGDSAKISALYAPSALPTERVAIDSAEGLNRVSLSATITEPMDIVGLARIDPTSIAIFRHPDLPGTTLPSNAAPVEYIEMRFSTSLDGRESRLFWEHRGNGHWQIVASSHLDLL